MSQDHGEWWGERIAIDHFNQGLHMSHLEENAQGSMIRSQASLLNPAIGAKIDLTRCWFSSSWQPPTLVIDVIGACLTDDLKPNAREQTSIRVCKIPSTSSDQTAVAAASLYPFLLSLQVIKQTHNPQKKTPKPYPSNIHNALFHHRRHRPRRCLHHGHASLQQARNPLPRSRRHPSMLCR